MVGLKIKKVPFVKALTNVCASAAAVPASPTLHVTVVFHPAVLTFVIARLFP